MKIPPDSQWSKGTFLVWLDNWEEQVTTRTYITDSEKECRLLSQETMLGIRITGTGTEVTTFVYKSLIIFSTCTLINLFSRSIFIH